MLETTVFLCGALVMILEMTGARVLAPHVGTSAIVWTSLIGVVLACLAIGSYAGGKFADKKLSRAGLAQTLALAGTGCMLTAFFHAAIGSGIASAIPNLYIAALFSAVCIFAFPAFFFGMVTPYVIRLRIASVDTAGATVGRLYALSTAGSILGTFLGGFLLVSWFSSVTILWALSFCIIALSLANFSKHPWLRILLLAACIFFAWHDQSYAKWLAEKNGTYLVESPYNSIRIMQGIDYSRNNAKVMLMATDPGYTQSGMLADDPEELYFSYTRFYSLGSLFTPDAKKVLMLGGGGYSVPKWLLSNKSLFDKNLQLTVVELDPAMTETAKKFFALKENPQMKIIHEDGRAFLNRQKEKYDLIFADVFNSHYSIPFQMGTKQAMEAMRNAMNPGGTMLMNLISAVEGENGRLFRAIWQNLVNIFPEVQVFCVSNPENPDKIQNLMLIAHIPDGKTPMQKNFAAYTSLSPDIAEITKMQANRYTNKIINDVPPLTDAYSPVERYALMLNQ